MTTMPNPTTCGAWVDTAYERQMIAETPERVRPHPFNPDLVTGDNAYLYLRGLAPRLLDEIDRLQAIVSAVAEQTNGYWNGNDFTGDRAEAALHAIANALGEPF